MKKIKNLVRYLPILMIVVTLVLTQYLIPINVGSKKIYIYYTEIFIILLCIVTFIDTIKNKKKLKLDKKYILYLLAFIIWFIILTIYRYVFYQTLTGGFIIFRVLFFPIVLCILFKQYDINKKDILFALLLFISIINLYQIYSLIFVSNSFRVIGALKNINIYLTFVVSSTPMMITYLLKSKDFYKSVVFRRTISILIILNIILITTFVFLSGSRLAILIYPVVSILSFFFNYKFNKRSIIKFLSIFIVSMVLIFTIVGLNLYDSKSNFSRSFNPIITTLKLNNIFNSSGTNNNKEENNSETKEGEDSKEENISIIDSDNMRTKLWEKSIYYIKQNPIFGKSSVDIDIEMKFVNSDETTTVIQVPHNFILEMWLGLGLPGMIMYLFLIGYLVLKVIKKNINLNLKMNFMLTLFSILAFSFLQPLVTCYFVISMLFWFNFYLYLKEE